MAKCEATVVPRQPVGQDGLADVWLRGDINKLEVFKIEHRGTSTTQTIIEKSVYAPGLIRLNTQNLPQGPVIELEVDVTTDDRITHQDWPQGGVYFK